MQKVKQWHCNGGHVLGVIVRNGAGVPQLMIYRHAVDAAAEAPAEVDVMLGPVLGGMQVKCDLCGDVKPWQVSVETLIHLVMGLPSEHLFSFWRRLLELAKHNGQWTVDSG